MNKKPPQKPPHAPEEIRGCWETTPDPTTCEWCRDDYREACIILAELDSKQTRQVIRLTELESNHATLTTLARFVVDNTEGIGQAQLSAIAKALAAGLTVRYNAGASGTYELSPES